MDKKYCAFLDGMTSVFSLSGIFCNERFVPHNNYQKGLDKYKNRTIEEQVSEDIYSDFIDVIGDINLAIKNYEQ